MAGFYAAARRARRLAPIALELYRRWDRLPEQEKQRYIRIARENAQRAGRVAREGAARGRDAASRGGRSAGEVIRRRRGR